MTQSTLLKKHFKVGFRPARVVDAITFNTPTLSQILKLKNLLNFLIQSSNSFANNSSQRSSYTEHTLLCIDNLIGYQSEQVILNGETKKILIELVDEAKQFKNIIKEFSDNTTNSSPEKQKRLELQLTSKASQLQWHSVSLLEELNFFQPTH